MIELKSLLTRLASMPEEWIHNSDISNNQTEFLELVCLNLIEPAGLRSRLTQHARDALKELEVNK